MLTLAGSANYRDDGTIIISLRDESGTYVYDQANPAKCGYYPKGASLDQFIPDSVLAYKKMREYIHQEMKPGAGYHQGEMNVVLTEKLRTNPDVVMLGSQTLASTDAAKLSEKTIVLPTYASEGGQRDGMMKKIQSLLQQNPLPKRIVIPVGLAGTSPMHFNSIVIEPGQPTQIYGFDPFGERSGYHPQLARLIDDIKKRNPKLVNADVSYNQARLQQDGSSCGLWTAWFIKDVASRSGVAISQYDNVINSHNVHQRVDFIQKEYQQNKQRLQSGLPDIQSPTPDYTKKPIPEITAPKKPIPTPLVSRESHQSENWEIIKRSPTVTQSRAEAPIVRDPRVSQRSLPQTLASQPHRFDTDTAKFSHPFPVMSQESVVYKEKKPPKHDSGYRVEVSTSGVIMPVHTDPAKFPNNKNDTIINNYRDALLKTMKYAIENNGMKTFEIASTTFPKSDHLYMDRLKVVFEVAKTNGIKVTLSEADNKKLNEIYMSQRVDASLRDKAKLMIESAHDARFIEPPRSPSFRS